VWARRWMRLIISYMLMLSGPVYGSLLRVKNQIIEEYPDPNSLTITMVGDYATAYADFQARMGMVQLGKLDSIISKRRALAKLYDRELQNISNLITAPIIDGATYLLYSMRVKRRDEIDFRRQMLDLGVGVEQSYHYALPSARPYRSYARETYPCAEQLAREVVNLPVYPGLSLEKAEYIADSVRRCLKRTANSKVFSISHKGL